jgi:preprotein translocase subunit YajC
MLISQAYAQTGGAPGGFGGLESILPLILIFVVFYMLLIRPQQKKMKEQREKIAGVKRGDRVVTSGGIVGLVTKEIGDHEVQVEIAEGIRVRVVKGTISDILARGQPVRAAQGGKEAAVETEEDKPFIGVPADPSKPGEPVRRPGLLDSLFGRKKS